MTPFSSLKREISLMCFTRLFGNCEKGEPSLTDGVISRGIAPLRK